MYIQCLLNSEPVSIFQENLVADTAQKARVMREGWKWGKIGRRSAEKAVTNIKAYVLQPKSRRLHIWSSSNMWLEARQPVSQ